MENSAFVAKIGGERALEFESNVDNISSTNNSRLNMRVISAMRDEDFNTTTNLTQVVSLLKQGDKNGAMDVLKTVQEFHHDSLDQKIPGFSTNTQMQELLDKEFKGLKEKINSTSEYKNLSDSSDNSIDGLSITCFGDDISAKLLHLYESQNGGKSHLINPYDFHVSSPSHYVEILKNYLDTILVDGKQHTIFTSGHGAVYEKGIVNEYGRGYSDPTVSKAVKAVSKLLGSNEFDIITLNFQKSVEGLLSTDPRERAAKNGLIQPQLIEEVHIDLAQRLSSPLGPNAQVLNASSIGPEEREMLMNDSRIGILLSNPDSSVVGTRIVGRDTDSSVGPQFVLRNHGLKQGYNRLNTTGNTIYLLGENMGIGKIGGGFTDIIDKIDSSLKKKGIVEYSSSVINGLGENIALNFRSNDDSDEALIALHRELIEKPKLADVA